MKPAVSIPALTRRPLLIGMVACFVLVFGIGDGRPRPSFPAR